jgi:hypothetical protein
MIAKYFMSRIEFSLAFMGFIFFPPRVVRDLSGQSLQVSDGVTEGANSHHRVVGVFEYGAMKFRRVIEDEVGLAAFTLEVFDSEVATAQKACKVKVSSLEHLSLCVLRIHL